MNRSSARNLRVLSEVSEDNQAIKSRWLESHSMHHRSPALDDKFIGLIQLIRVLLLRRFQVNETLAGAVIEARLQEISHR